METQKYRVEIISVDELKPLLGNSNDYKIHSIEKLHKLKNSISRYGQLKPVILCKDVIVSGSKVLMASIEAGLKEVMCYVLKDDLDEKARTFISLSLNELHFDTDYLKIAFQYNKIFDNAQEAISLLPFSPHDMEKMKMIKDHDWDEFMNRGSNSNQVDLFEVAAAETENQQNGNDNDNTSDTASDDNTNDSDNAVIEPDSESASENVDSNSISTSDDGGSVEEIPEVEKSEEKSFVFPTDLDAKEETPEEKEKREKQDQEFEDILERKKPIEEAPVEPVDSDAPYHVGMKGTRTSRGKVMNVEITAITEKAISYIDTDTEKKHKDEIHKFEKFFAPNPDEVAALTKGTDSDESVTEVDESVTEEQEIVSKDEENVTEPEKIETDETTTDNSETQEIENEDINAVKNAARLLKYDTEYINEYFDAQYDESKTLSINLKAFRDWADKKMREKPKTEEHTIPTKEEAPEHYRDVNGRDVYVKVKAEDEARKLQEELQEDVVEGRLDVETAQDVMKATEKVPEPEAVKMDPFMKRHKDDVDLTKDRTNEDFYINERRHLIVVNYQQEIVNNLPILTKMILETKYNQAADFDFERVTIQQTQNEETKEVEVHHILYMSMYGVKFNMVLEELYDYLEKIDFEPQEEPNTLF
jgi:hypothetical protein